jgi:Na+/H+ antiporter NhaC
METIGHFGAWSVLPPVLAIILAIRTKQVYLSLILGIWMGWMIIHSGNLFTGTLATMQGLVDVFKDEGSTRTILFSGLIGALILFIQKSGGVQGFVDWMENRMEKLDPKKETVFVQFFSWITGVLIFVESNISVLTVGTLFRPIYDRLKISREKLAYVADSSSAPACILMPFNAWGAFIIGLLITQGIDDPFSVLFSSIKYNFYPILALLAVPMVIFFRWDFKGMKKAEERTRGGQVLNVGAQPMISESLIESKIEEGVVPKARNMLLPIFVMVASVPLMLYYTGRMASANPQAEDFFTTMSQGSGSTAVLSAVVFSIICAFIIYKIQGIFQIRKMAEMTIKGISEMIPLAILMLLAFAIGNVSKELNTGIYLAELTKTWLSPSLLPFLLFIISGAIAFSTGTSWGTFGIMVAIAVPMARGLDAALIPAIAAILGGGIFGDHCSPISDTTIISSMAAATDHIDHVRTQLPYALILGITAAMGYLILGLIN